MTATIVLDQIHRVGVDEDGLPVFARVPVEVAVWCGPFARCADDPTGEHELARRISARAEREAAHLVIHEAAERKRLGAGS